MYGLCFKFFKIWTQIIQQEKNRLKSYMNKFIVFKRFFLVKLLNYLIIISFNKIIYNIENFQ